MRERRDTASMAVGRVRLGLFGLSACPRHTTVEGCGRREEGSTRTTLIRTYPRLARTPVRGRRSRAVAKLFGNERPHERERQIQRDIAALARERERLVRVRIRLEADEAERG
jgi:hypothetical protein